MRIHEYPIATEVADDDRLLGMDKSDPTESTEGSTKTFPLATIANAAAATLPEATPLTETEELQRQIDCLLQFIILAFGEIPEGLESRANLL